MSRDNTPAPWPQGDACPIVGEGALLLEGGTLTKVGHADSVFGQVGEESNNKSKDMATHPNPPIIDLDGPEGESGNESKDLMTLSSPLGVGLDGPKGEFVLEEANFEDYLDSMY